MPRLGPVGACLSAGREHTVLAQNCRVASACLNPKLGQQRETPRLSNLFCIQNRYGARTDSNRGSSSLAEDDWKLFGALCCGG